MSAIDNSSQLTKETLREHLCKFKNNSSINTHSRIRATNDMEAIERWLDEYFDKPTTFRSYKKEAERFLVWCVVERGTSLSQLDREDVSAYTEFLKDPQPREKWCGPRTSKKSLKGSRVWYPFAKGLSESAINTALAVLNSLMSYLVDANYINYNPFILVRRKSRFKQKIQEQSLRIQDRILQDHEWQLFIETMNEEPQANELDLKKKSRLIFIINILFFLGLRIEELAQAAWCDFKSINGKWWFFVRGKGDRLGKIPVNRKMLHAVMHYRHFCGLSPLPSSESTQPIVSSLKDLNRGLSSRQISSLIKALAQKAANKLEHDPQAKQKMLRFSPHWLRHLSASRQDALGISFTNIKSNLRHQNEQTTRQYVHSYDDDRHKEMEKLKL